MQHAANAAHLLAAARASRAAVNQRRQRRAVPRGFLGACLIHHQDSAVIRREPKDDLGGEGVITCKHRRRETAGAAPRECDRLGGIFVR